MIERLPYSLRWWAYRYRGAQRLRNAHLVSARDRLFFIVGSQRSGTTLLQLALDAHPELVVHPERRSGELVGRPVEEAAEQVIGFKLPMWTLEHRRLRAMYPQAKYLFLRRDILAVVASMLTLQQTSRRWLASEGAPEFERTIHCVSGRRLRRLVVAEYTRARAHDDWLAIAALIAWVKDDAVHEYVRADVPVLSVRYEDLVTRPRAAFERMLTFLGVAWSEAVLEHHHSGVGISTGGTVTSRPIDRASLERWRSVLDDAAAERIERLVERLESAARPCPLRADLRPPGGRSRGATTPTPSRGAPMIHVLTVHWKDDRWVDIQLRYLRAHLRAPFRTYAYLNGLPGRYARNFDYVSTAGIVEHAVKLNALADVACASSRHPDDILVFIDGDAFPIADLAPYLTTRLAHHPLIAVQRLENSGDRQPHPCFAATTVATWRRIRGDWSAGFSWTTADGNQKTDVGGNLLRLLGIHGVDWYPMLRSNRVNRHPLLFGIYDSVVYHHGAGFREGVSHSERARHGIRNVDQAILDGRRDSGHPARAIYAALLAEHRALKAQMFEEIRTDDRFYLALQ